MATVNNENDQNSQQNPAGGPVSISGTAGASASAGQGAGAPGAASPVSMNQPQTNQGYTDVGSYLDANQAGSAKLGTDVAGNLTNQYNQTKSSIGNSANDTINQVNQGYTKSNTDLINQVAADPTAAAANHDTLSQFQSQLNNTYTGPTSWADQGNLQGQVAQAQQYGGLNKTPGGLNVLTSELEGPQASQGVNQLDTMLLGGNPNSMQKVNAAADPYASLTDYLNSQGTNVTGAISQGQTEAQKSSQAAQDAFLGANGTYTNLNNQVTKQSADALSAAQASQAALKADIANLYGGQALDTKGTALAGYNGSSTPWGSTTNYSVGQLSPQDLQTLGITQDQWNALQSGMQAAGTSDYMTGHNFGAGSTTTQQDLMSYLQMQDPTTAINPGTTATADQYAQMDAIQKLLGDKMPQGAAINPLNASQAGTYNPASLNNFNYDQALKDVQNYDTQSTKEAQDAANYLTASADLGHAQSQHTGGLLGGLKNMATHPLQTALASMNPLTYPSTAMSALKGGSINPLNFNQPGAKLGGSVAGGILGSYLGPAGTYAGSAIGGALGTGVEYAGQSATDKLNSGKPQPGDTTKSGLAHGGEVKSIDEYLDSKKGK